MKRKAQIELSEHELRADCWMCQGISEQAHMVFFESRTSVGKLNPDQFFKGYSFITLKWHCEELYRLSEKDRKSFLDDMSRVAAALSKTLHPDKMNYELLGNGMPHLHWHLIPRFKSDPLWGRPIWTGPVKRKRLVKGEYETLVKEIKTNLED
jgi:diadenosine tetraphosphate (Ap4A) HIT family hydrolase